MKLKSLFLYLFFFLFVYEYQQLEVNFCQKNNCEFLPKYYSNLTKGIEESYSELILNPLENTINFLFHNDFFIYTDDMIGYLIQYNAFEDWELKLGRKLKIVIKPAICASDLNCQKKIIFFIKSKFLSIYGTSEIIISNIIFDGRDINLDFIKYKDNDCYNNFEGCCFLTNFTNLGDDCFLNLNSRNKASQLVFFNFSKIDSNIIIKTTEFKNILSINNDIYYDSLILVVNCTLDIFNSEFSVIYLKSSLINAFDKTNIIIRNSSFFNYNPYQFYESSFSYLFNMGKGVISFMSLNNTMKNTTFIINSNSRVNIFDKNIFLIIPTSTFDKLYNENFGVFKFGSFLNCEIRNSFFYGITNNDKNKFLSKIILFFYDGYTNSIIDNSIFSDFLLQEGTILKINNYNNFNLTNSIFININHTCNENPSTSCVYPVFKFESYNNLRFQNITFEIIILRNEIGFIYFNTFNNIFWNVVSIRFTDFVSVKSAALINFAGFNQIDLTKIYIREFIFSGNNNFFNLAVFNRYKITFSVLSNNSPKTSSFNLLFAASTNTIMFDTCIIINFTSLYASLFMLITVNSLTINNCQFSNIQALYGSIILLMEVNNVINFINSVARNLYARVGGSFLYSMSKIVLNILNSIFISAKSSLQGGLIYIETGTKSIIKDSIFLQMESLLTGGTIIGISSNSFVFINITVLSSLSLSNGGFIYLTQNNQLLLYNTTINNSGTTNGQGGILFSFQNNSIELENNNLSNIFAEQEGGSFFLDFKNYVILKNCFIYNSTSRSDGGFIFFKQENVLKSDNIIINSSFASFSAGFLKAQKNNSLEMNDIKFNFITSLKEGGIYYIDINNNLKLKNNNGIEIRSVYGSVVWSSKNVLEINSCHFREIYALSNGGAFYFFEENIFIIENSNFSNIENGIGYGAFLYASEKNILNLSLLTIESVYCKAKGGFVYLKNYNKIFINSSILNNISAYEEGSTLFLGHLNLACLNNNLLNYFHYFNAFSFDESNTIIIRKNIFNVKFAKHHKNFILSNINNTFDSEFDRIKFENNEDNLIILFLLLELNVFKLVKTKIFMDSCKNFFSVFANSIFYIEYFMLNGFHSDFSEALIHIENSKFTLLTALVKNSKFKSFLNSINSNISIINAFFSINFPYVNLIIMANTKLSIYRTIYKNKKNNIVMNIIEGTNSKLILNLIDVISFYSYPIGSAITITNSNLSLKNSFLSFNKAQFSTILNIKFTDTSKIFSINLKKNIFLENKGKIYAGIMFIDSLNSIQIITNLERNNILFNQASRGAVIKTNYVNSLLFNFNKFSKNSAPSSYSSSNVNRSKGGVLYSSKLKNLKLISNSFMKNKAEIGGIIYFDDPIKNNLLIQNYKNKFENNIADYYGNEFASSTIKLRFFSLEKNLINSIFHLDSYINGNIGQIRSGIEYNDCQLKINGYDYFNQITYNTDEDFLYDYKHVSLTNASNNIFFPSIRSGFICFNQKFLRDSFPITGAFKYELLFPSFQREKLNLVLEFTNCNVGERLTEDLSCSPCPKSLYNFQRDFSKLSDVCKNCDNENFYCFGGGNVTIKPGYWRIAEDSYEFYRCPNKYACLGDPRNFSNLKTEYIPIYSVSNCDVGYKGILCSECDDNYGFLDGHYCSSCDNQNYFLQVISNIIIRLIFTMYLISVSINMCLSLMSENPKTSRILASNLLKILTNHIQILGIISALPISFPSELKSISDYLMNISPNVSEAFSIECLLKSMNLDLSLQYFKMCFSGIYPFLIVFFFVLLIKVLTLLKKGMKNSNNKISFSMQVSKEKNISISKIKLFDLIYTVLILVFLICYADISKMTFAMFSCVEIGDGNYKKKLLFSDLRINCDSSYHKKWILQAAMPILIFFLAAYPLMIIYNISKKIKEKKNEHCIFSFKYGYFFYAYKENVFFWDFVILARKLILIFINSFFLSRVTDFVEIYPILIVIAIISFSFIIQVYCKPFEEKFGILNKIEEFSLIVSYFSLLIALFYMISNQLDNKIIFFLFFVALILNIFFFLIWIRIYYIFYFKEKIGRIFNNPIIKKNEKRIIVKDLQKIEIKERKTNQPSFQKIK